MNKLRNLLDWLDYQFTLWVYVRRSVTEECGLPFEGRMFGVPAWFSENDRETAIGVPKFVPLQLYCMLADVVLDFWMGFMPSTFTFDPITIFENKVD